MKGKVEKGLAFPTCLSVNHCAGHFSPLLENTSKLQEGDLVKIDLGVHIDGYIAQIAFTWILTTDRNSPIQGRAADVLYATHLAAEAALRLLRPGQKVNEFKRLGKNKKEISIDFRILTVSGLLIFFSDIFPRILLLRKPFHVLPRNFNVNH